MNKYFLHPNHINDTIITRSNDGTELVVNAATFNDFFAEIMIKNGQHHLIMPNKHYNEETAEKKTYQVITDTVISLTSNPLQIEEKELNQTAKEQESKPNVGRGRPRKA